MITSAQQAVAVQTSRRRKGLKGRSKAVRRWFKREYGRAIEAHPCSIGVDYFCNPNDRLSLGRRQKVFLDLKQALSGDFTGCRNFEETHLSTQSVGRILRKNQPVEIHTFDHPGFAECESIESSINVHLGIFNDK